MEVLRFIIFFLNLFFVFAALALLSMGIRMQISVGSVFALVKLDYLELQTAPFATIVLAIVVLFIAYLGCCSSVKQSYCMLLSYAVLMSGLVLCKVGLVVVLFTDRNTLAVSVPEVLASAFSNSSIKFETLQSGLNCCGTTGASSYGGSYTLPSSCCKHRNCTDANAYIGCNYVLASKINNLSAVIGSLVITVAIFEVVAVVLALIYAHHVRNDRRNGN